MAPSAGDSLSRSPLPRTIIRDQYTPAIISLVANTFLYSGSRVYHRKFGVRTNEWRVLSALGNHPGCTASEAAQVLGLNKSVISRSVALLKTMGLVVIEREIGAKRLYLTAEGVGLHDEVMDVALAREAKLLDGFDDDERRQLLGYLVRMHHNSEGLQEYDDGLIAEAGGVADGAETGGDGGGLDARPDVTGGVAQPGDVHEPRSPVTGERTFA